MAMDKEKAVEVIKQMYQRCSRLEGKTTKLTLPNADNTLSTGYQIHVDGDDDLLYSCLISVAKQNNLAVKKGSSKVIIYNPSKKNLS